MSDRKPIQFSSLLLNTLGRIQAEASRQMSQALEQEAEMRDIDLEGYKANLNAGVWVPVSDEEGEPDLELMD